MDLRIAGIEGREVLDSRGSPTMAVEVTLADGTIAQLIVPSGLEPSAFIRRSPLLPEKFDSTRPDIPVGTG